MYYFSCYFNFETSSGESNWFRWNLIENKVTNPVFLVLRCGCMPAPFVPLFSPGEKLIFAWLNTQTIKNEEYLIYQNGYMPAPHNPRNYIALGGITKNINYALHCGSTFLLVCAVWGVKIWAFLYVAQVYNEVPFRRSKCPRFGILLECILYLYVVQNKLIKYATGRESRKIRSRLFFLAGHWALRSYGCV